MPRTHAAKSVLGGASAGAAEALTPSGPMTAVGLGAAALELSHKKSSPQPLDATSAARANGNGAKSSVKDDRAPAERLLAWFDEKKRPLPWRATSDVYRIWISEVMLQQTRVETVIPYYERFLRRFPTVLVLAEAPEDDVLGAWAGLGYYRRARNLHRAAKQVAGEHGGDFPRTVAGLRGLAGVGDYTASAVASIAFGVRAAVLDGNVARVTARWRAVDAEIERAATKKRLVQIAEELLVEGRAGDSNQALMELGATVCVPERPRCGECPIAVECVSRAEGTAAEYPKTLPPKSVPKEIWAAAVIATERGAVLLFRRRSEGLFGGLWEPPMGKGTAAALAKELAASGVELGKLAATKGAAGKGPAGRGGARAVGSVVHVLTHKELEVKVSAAVIAKQVRAAPFGPYEDARWVDEGALEGVGKSKLAQRVLALARRGS